MHANLPRGQPPFFAPILPVFDKFLYRQKAAPSGAIPSPQSRAHSPTTEGLALQCNVKRGVYVRHASANGDPPAPEDL